MASPSGTLTIEVRVYSFCIVNNDTSTVGVKSHDLKYCYTFCSTCILYRIRCSVLLVFMDANSGIMKTGTSTIYKHWKC
jgi:hypothetical protein